MKNYSTEAYYAYARRMLEGEAGKANLPDKSDDDQFKKIIVGAGTGAVGAVACLKYLDTTFSIKSLNDSIINLRGYASRVSHWSAEAAKNGGKGMPSILQKVLGFFRGLVGKALIWVRNFCNSILKGFPGLSKPIFNGSGNFAAPTYGSVLCMALVGAAVGAVIYRIYKFIRNRRKKTESVAAFNARKNREYKAILVETVAFFDGLERLTELRGSDVQTSVVGRRGKNQLTRTTYGGNRPRFTGGPDKTERMLQASRDNMNLQAAKRAGIDAGEADRLARADMNLQAAKRAGIDAGEADRLARADMAGRYANNPDPNTARAGFMGKTKTPTTTATTAAKEAPAKAEGFLNSMKDRLMAMWTSVKTWCSANPVLATMVGICAALVACWYGVKKYKESQAKKAGAAQTA